MFLPSCPAQERVSRSACIQNFAQEPTYLIFSLSLCSLSGMLRLCIAYDTRIQYPIMCLTTPLFVSTIVVFMHGDNFLTMIHVCLCHSLSVYLFERLQLVEWHSWLNGWPRLTDRHIPCTKGLDAL